MNRIGCALTGAALAYVPSIASAQAGLSATSSTPVQAAPVTAVMVQRPVEVVNGSMLPSNSDVWVSLDHEVSSKKMKERETFPVTVSRDVMLGNYVVIPRGTPGRGQISYRTGKGAFGKSAKMEFDITDVTLNGRVIPVGGHYRIEGQGNTGATVGTAVAAGPFAAFVTGRSAVAAQGSEWKSSTKEPLMVSLASAPPPPVAGVPANAAPAMVVKTK